MLIDFYKDNLHQYNGAVVQYKKDPAGNSRYYRSENKADRNPNLQVALAGKTIDLVTVLISVIYKEIDTFMLASKNGSLYMV